MVQEGLHFYSGNFQATACLLSHLYCLLQFILLQFQQVITDQGLPEILMQSLAVNKGPDNKDKNSEADIYSFRGPQHDAGKNYRSKHGDYIKI